MVDGIIGRSKEAVMVTGVLGVSMETLTPITKVTTTTRITIATTQTETTTIGGRQIFSKRMICRRL
jgi:CO dehydrogenase/acetyl-CoA synthase epsilon subunit